MKKRILALILSVLTIMSFTACKKADNTDKPEIGTQHDANDGIKTIKIITGEGYKEEYDEDSYDTIIKVAYPVVMLYYGDENNYSGLSKALEDNNKSEKEYLLNFLNENKDYATECYLEGNEYFSPFESSVTSYVRRADTQVTSILYFGYEYTGGVHGNYYYYGKNYDTKSGKELVLSDVINDKDKLAKAVSEQLDKHWSDIEFNESFDIAEIINDETAISWTLDYNGITIYFMPYSIASYASGVQIVTISNEEYPDVLKAEYKNTPSSYGIELSSDTPFYYDVTGDGVVDEIFAGGYESNEGDSGCIDITVNGESFEEEEWFYGYDATFVHTADGKNYIYYEILRENDYRETVCYDLSYGVKKAGSVDGGLRRIYHEGGDFLTTQDALTNPEDFYLKQTTQKLSTVSGYKEYRTGDDGIPVTDDTYFTFDEESTFTFTLLQDLEAEVYDEKKNTINGNKTLKAGDEVLYYSTDNERFALLKCSDGTICRVEAVYDSDLGYIAIDGVNIEEIFDGIIFAG